MKNGEITDFEIEATKLAVVNSFKSSSDSVSGIENWYTGRIFNGDLETVEEVSAEVNAVTKEQIVNAANKLLLDTVYVLKISKGGGKNEYYRNQIGNCRRQLL